MSKYTPALAASICASLAEGSSLRAAAESAGVSHSTVLDWCESRPDFADQYARARLRGYHLMADEIKEISDSSGHDRLPDGKADQEVIARDRLRVDTRKWLLSKMLPKVYGDKAALEVSGKDGQPVQVTVVSGVPRADSGEDLL